MSMTSASSLLLLLPIIITVLTSSVLGHPIQEAHAQKSDADKTGWTGFWGDFSGAPPANASASSLFLIVKWIYCGIPEDLSTDETVLKIHGLHYTQWGPNSMSAGETRLINIEAAFDPARNDIRMEVWDYDRGDWLDTHDHIETEFIPARVTRGNVEYVFFGDGADYHVTVQVVQRR